MQTNFLNRLLILIILSGILLTGVGYAQSQYVTNTDDTNKEGSTSPIYTVIAEGDFQFHPYKDPNLALPAEVIKWVSEHVEKEYAGSMIYQNQTYILLTRGASSSSGYGIDLQDIQKIENQVLVEAAYINPEPGKGYLTMITYPAILLQVDQVLEDVQFEIK